MSHHKENISDIWNDLERVRAPKSQLAGIFDQLATTQPKSEGPLKVKKLVKRYKPAAADKQNG